MSSFNSNMPAINSQAPQGPIQIGGLPPVVTNAQPPLIREALLENLRRQTPKHTPSFHISPEIDILTPEPRPNVWEGGFAAMLEESNFVLTAMRVAREGIAGLGFEDDPDFDAKAHSKRFKMHLALKSKDHLEWVNESKSHEEYLHRLDVIASEIDRTKAIAELSFGEALGISILGGITDPVSYVPLFGPIGKVKQVSKAYRTATKMTMAGSKGARRELMRGALASSVWTTGAESFAIESAFQGMLYADRVDKSEGTGGILPSIALTTVFGGILGGGVGYLGRRADVSAIVGRAEARLEPDLVSPQVMSLALGSRSTLESTLGKGSGARARVNLKKNLIAAREKQKASLMELAMNLGIADNEVEASRIAANILAQDPRWLAPIRQDGSFRSDLDVSAAQILAGMGDDATPKNIGIAKGKITKKMKARIKADERKISSIIAELDKKVDSGEMSHSEAATILNRELGEFLEEFDMSFVEEALSGKMDYADAYAKMKSLALKGKKNGRVVSELRELRSKLDEVGAEAKKRAEGKAEGDAVDATKDAASRNLNNPRAGTTKDVTARDAAQDPAVQSVGKKADDVSGEGALRKLAQLAADAKNGTADWLNFVRYGLGRGMFAFIADRGDMAFSFRNPDGSRLSLKLNVKKASLPGKDVGGYDPKTGQIWVDYDYIIKNWNEIREEERFFADGVELTGTDWQALAKNVSEGQNRRVKDFARSPQEFADWVIMHEVAHHRLMQEQQDMLKAIDEFGKKNNLPEKEIEHVKKMAIEGQTNQLAQHWRNEAELHGPKDRPDVNYGLSDGPIPKDNSIPLKEGETPIHGLQGNYFAQGFSRLASKYATKLARIISPALRAATSPSETLRALSREMFETPFFLGKGANPDGSASTRVRMYYESPVKVIRKDSIAAWQNISRKTETPITWEEFDERVFMAIATGKDNKADDFSSIILDTANRYTEVNETLFRRGDGVAFSGKGVFPEGERYYRRVYDNGAVDTPEFLALLVKHGATMASARTVQQAIRGNIGLFADELGDKATISVKGAIKSRNEFLRGIPVEELMPFLNRSAFETQLNAARSIGGEIEMRRGIQRLHREIIRKHPDRVLKEAKEVKRADGTVEVQEFTRNVIYSVNKTDEQGELVINPETGEPESILVFDFEPIKYAIEQEMFNAKFDKDKVSFIDKDSFSLAFSMQRRKHPDVAEKFGLDDRWEMEMSRSQWLSESEFADRYANDIIRMMQHSKDIPENPDSWFHVRLPNLIKNFSHTIMGGSLGIANLADFHRSVTEYGFKHVFKNEWSLWIKDVEAWQARNKLTERMGLALEDQVADVERMLRNAQEHYVGETMIEKLAEGGASMMSKLNLMDKVANTHQRMFSSGTQAYIIDNLEGFINGTLSKTAQMKMDRLGLDMRSAKAIKHFFDQGGLKTSKAGNKYVDFDAFGFSHAIDDMGTKIGPAEAKGFFAAAVNRGVALTQTVPGRHELHDIQVQGWGGVLFMYRNWVTAANNRIMASAISNPTDAALLSGIVASVGLGALIQIVRAGLSGDSDNLPWNDPQQFVRRSIDSGGYFGLVGEANNLVSRITDGTIDLNPIGTGSNRYYTNTTALAAVIGPAWHYPDFIMKTLKPGEFDRHDVERIRGMIPFMNLFYIDGLWNMMEKGIGEDPYPNLDKEAFSYPDPDWKSLNPFKRQAGIEAEFERRGIDINTGQPKKKKQVLLYHGDAEALSKALEQRKAAQNGS